MIDNLEDYDYEFTTSAITTYVKVTPYIGGVLSPAYAKICTFTVSSAPTSVSLDVSTNNISITWDAVPSANSYAIRVFCNGVKVFSKVVTTNSAVVIRTNIANNINTTPFTDIEFRISAVISMISGIESSNIWTPDPTNLIFCKTYDDAILSGTPKIVRFQDPLGTFGYTKVYPTLSASLNGTVDNIGYNLYGLTDAVLSGTAKVTGIKSNDIFYFTKVFPTISAESSIIAGADLTLDFLSDVTLSGSSRVAEIQLNGVNYYLKVYPTRS